MGATARTQEIGMRIAVVAGVAAAAAAVTASPAAAFVARLNGQRVPPGKAATLTVSTPAPGEFAYSLRASSDGPKRLRLTLRRPGARPFVVLSLPGATGDDLCEGAAGSVFCGGFTTPAPVKGTNVIRVINRSSRPMTVTLRVTFRRVRGG